MRSREQVHRLAGSTGEGSQLGTSNPNVGGLRQTGRSRRGGGSSSLMLSVQQDGLPSRGLPKSWRRAQSVRKLLLGFRGVQGGDGKPHRSKYVEGEAEDRERDQVATRQTTQTMCGLPEVQGATLLHHEVQAGRNPATGLTPVKASKP